jgi:hypothetical protein
MCTIAHFKALSLCFILGEIANRRNMALRLNKDMAILICLIGSREHELYLKDVRDAEPPPLRT